VIGAPWGFGGLATATYLFDVALLAIYNWGDIVKMQLEQFDSTLPTCCPKVLLTVASTSPVTTVASADPAVMPKRMASSAKIFTIFIQFSSIYSG
jgi:hypothetical protein